MPEEDVSFRIIWVEYLHISLWIWMQFYNMKIHLKPDEASKGMTTILMSALRHMLPIMH